MLPPKNVKPSALWLKLQESPWPSEVMAYPRNGVNERIRIRVLSGEEQDIARDLALEKIKARLSKQEDLALSVVQEGVYSDAVAREVLALVCLMPDPWNDDPARPQYARVFTDGDMVAKLPPSEVLALFTAFELVQQKYSPSPRTITTAAELNAWIMLLAKGGDRFPLARVPLLQLAELATLLAERAYGISAILESQFSTLPDTLKSALEPYSIGTGYFGEQQSTESSSMETGIFGSDAPELTMADAAEIARRMHEA